MSLNDALQPVLTTKAGLLVLCYGGVTLFVCRSHQQTPYACFVELYHWFLV